MDPGWVEIIPLNRVTVHVRTWLLSAHTDKHKQNPLESVRFAKNKIFKMVLYSIWSSCNILLKKKSSFLEYISVQEASTLITVCKEERFSQLFVTLYIFTKWMQKKMFFNFIFIPSAQKTFHTALNTTFFSCSLVHVTKNMQLCSYCSLKPL